MVAKYVDGFIARNDNIVAPRRVKIFDDNGVLGGGLGVVPSAQRGTVSVSETSNGVINRTIITCTALPITVTDDAGQGQYGGKAIYNFPEGMLCTMGAVVSGALTLGTTGTIIDAFTGVVALGSITATTGSTLVSTEATFLQSCALTTAVAKVAAVDAVSVAAALTEAGSRWVDGTATAPVMYLNFLVADDSSHTTATGTFTGVVTFVWMLLGDN